MSTAMAEKQAQHRKRRLLRREIEKKEMLADVVTNVLSFTPAKEVSEGGVLAYTPATLCRRSHPMPWNLLPRSIDPMESLKADAEGRGLRKRWQVESLVVILKSLVALLQSAGKGAAERRIRICDLGCGSGVFTVPVAAFLPECDFTACDINPYAIRLLKERAKAAAVTNIDRFLTSDVALFPNEEPFDICVAMHACGAATDHAQRCALRRGAMYILCPCCFGKIKLASFKGTSKRKQKQDQELQQSHSSKQKQEVARSSWLRGALERMAAASSPLSLGPALSSGSTSANLDVSFYDALASAADHTNGSTQPELAAQSPLYVMSTLKEVSMKKNDEDVQDESCGATSSALACLPNATVEALSSNPPTTEAVARSLLGADRNAAAREYVNDDADDATTARYSTTMTKLWPVEASTKNDVLIGVPKKFLPATNLSLLHENSLPEILSAAASGVSFEPLSDVTAKAVAEGRPATYSLPGESNMEQADHVPHTKKINILSKLSEMPYHVLLPGAPTRNTERSNSNINLDESVEQEESAPSASKVVGKECIAVEDGEDSKFEGINDDEHRCAFFIKRRRRRCTKRSCDCNSFCSDHQEGALARARAASYLQQREHAQWMAGQTDVESLISNGRNACGVSSISSLSHAKSRISATQRRMANPFSRHLTDDLLEAEPIPTPRQWLEDIFEEDFANRPLFIDVGCARGHCVRLLANKEPEWNFLGLEIRGALVHEAREETLREREAATMVMNDNVTTSLLVGQSRRNVHHLAVNVMDSPRFEALLASIVEAASISSKQSKGGSGDDGGGVVAAVAIQFPDPWTRQRHRRRRLVGQSLAASLARSQAVRPGAWVYVSSDVPDCVSQAASELVSTGRFRWHDRNDRWVDHIPSEKAAVHTASTGIIACEGVRHVPFRSWKTKSLPEVCDGLLIENPLGTDAPSERELVCEQLWRKVYRAIFIKL